MGGQFTERIALGLSTDMLRALEKEAKREGRTVLAQIRHFCVQGLSNTPKNDNLENDISDLKKRVHALELERAETRLRAGKKGKMAG